MALPEEMNSRFSHYLRLLIRRRRLFYLAIGLPLLFTILFTTIASPTYKATGKLLPTSDASQMGVIGILTGFFGSRGTPAVDGAPSSFLYVDILYSRSVVESVLEHEVEFIDKRGRTQKGKLRELLEYSYGTKGFEDFLGNNSAKSNFENGVITLTSIAKDPNLAAILLNTWIEKLDEFNRSVRITQASENLKYLEQRLEDSKEELDIARDSLVEFLEANRGYPRAATPRVEAEVRRLTAKREMKEQVYQLLMQEQEVAALNKQKTTPVVSVLDSASPPTEKDGPKRIPVFLVSLIFAFVVLLLSLSILEANDPTPQTPVVSWNELISALRADGRALANVLRRKR
ncbi:MAG TPA: hypothetical protein ENN07_02420 [candidate division Zixibacteria bacterium]|nr:hypothetical protein [candidate division Zixibacteria bacterium]